MPVTTLQPANVGAFANDPVADIVRDSFLKLQLGNVQSQPYNAPFNGTTDARAAIAAADGAVVANGGGSVVFPPGLYRIASNLTIASTVLFQGGILVLDAGVTVTLSGAILGPLQQYFSLGVGSVIAYGTTGKVPVIFPEWYGCLGDATADDTAPLQAAITAARAGQLLMKAASGAVYRITATLVSQPDGFFVANFQDWDNSVILVDFSGSDGYRVEGGAELQRIRNLTMKPVVARRLSAGGAYVAADVGLRIKNCRTEITADVQFFKGDGVVIESSSANSNYSDYNLRTLSNGRGVLITGTNDNLASCRAIFRSFLNSKEGVRADDLSTIRAWDANIQCEANWANDPTTATNYGVYIGAAINSDFVIYSEQTAGAKEIYFSPATANNMIDSRRRNQDVIFGSNVGRQGQILYQTSDGISTRYATPTRFMSVAARKANVGEYVRATFEAGDGVIADIYAEALGIAMRSAAGRALGINDTYGYSGPERTYGNLVALSSGLQTTTINIATVNAASVVIGELRVNGVSGGGTGIMTTVLDFRVDGTTLTAAAARISSAATPNPSTAVLQIVGGVLQLVLTYVSGQWGASYTFNYTIVGLFYNTN